MQEEWIPIIFFISTAAIAIAFLYWNHKTRLGVMEAVKQAIGTGQELTAELLMTLGGSFAPRMRDLRRGVVIFALGIAGMLASLFTNDPEAVMGLRIASIFPVMVGAGFLLVWKLNRYHE